MSAQCALCSHPWSVILPATSRPAHILVFTKWTQTKCSVQTRKIIGMVVALVLQWLYALIHERLVCRPAYILLFESLYCLAEDMVLFVCFSLRNLKVQFRPPIEEIRGRYFREMKKFMCLPHNFRGLLEKGVPGAVNFGSMVSQHL